MKTISYKALLWIINFSLIVYGFGGTLVIIFFLTGTIDSYHFFLGLESKQNYPLNEAYSVISTTNPSITNASLVATDVAISFNTTNPQLRFLFLSLTAFQLLYVGFILIILKRIIKSLQVNNPFSTKTIGDLRLIGILLLLIEPLYWVGHQIKECIIGNYFRHAIIDIGGFMQNIGYWAGLNFGSGSLVSSWIAAGLIVLILVEVFKQGLRIKEEQDLTI